MILTSTRSSVTLPSALLLYVLLVVAVAGIGGLRPGVSASVVAFVLADYYLIPPLHQLAIGTARERHRARHAADRGRDRQRLRDRQRPSERRGGPRQGRSPDDGPAQRLGDRCRPTRSAS